ncbi:hypothetical protein PHYSODRAFT_334212 [Phytophthora sojae]|uniref:Uncharacterized protein n=1 Tax=Phytophthora sojae (strain P6497) TaxID=1094619 RepID=G4ZM50_PHYSP|nr:hypothetical protein PHYSODRAFT_334212 [Phytophthora sojae]EGZ16017.1 hypothetical protein PHYSODRAFT_334212 [Phytophthora sojae]|eukprot:XP_009529766.1 hypothetical protein PHYSODRAFT_334212 [Phytophthora sojae]
MQAIVPWLNKGWKLRELVQEPVIVAPNLEVLVIEHCPMNKFNADTSLPQLKKLTLSSRNLSALQARDLPALRKLDLSSCAKLTRVHVTSKRLETLDLSRNDELQFVLLDLERVVDLDLSFLKSLTRLYFRSPSLRRLNLRGCDQLRRNTTSVHCPNLQFVVLQGTSLEVDDFNRGEVNDEVFALPVIADQQHLSTLRQGLARLTPEMSFHAGWRDPVYGYSPLANACSQGHLLCVQALLAYGVDCNARDSQRNTPLHIATACGKSEVVRLLLGDSGGGLFRQDIHQGANSDGHRTPLV